MSVVAAAEQGASRRPKGRPVSERVQIQSEAYNVAGAMAYQRTDLEAERMLNTAEDAMRAELHKVLTRQARALAERDLPLATTLNSVARVILGQVDDLDAAQDADPVVSAYGHNYEASASARRVIALTD